MPLFGVHVLDEGRYCHLVSAGRELSNNAAEDRYEISPVLAIPVTVEVRESLVIRVIFEELEQVVDHSIG